MFTVFLCTIPVNRSCGLSFRTHACLQLAWSRHFALSSVPSSMSRKMWSTWLRGKACNKSNNQVSGYGNMGHNVLICFQSEFLWQLLLCHESWCDICPGFQQLYMLVTASLLTKPLKTLSKIESSNPCHCSGPSATHASSQTFPRKTPPSTGSQSTCKVLPLAVAIGGSSWNSREACLPADFRLPLLSIECWWMKNPIGCFAAKDLFADPRIMQ